MTNVDVSKIKPGDVVGVRVLATNASGRSVNVRANGEFEHAWIPDHAIVSHTPAPRPALKVGDRVRHPSGVELEIVAPPRASEANDRKPEVTTWSEKNGYVVDGAAEVETWERLS